MECATYKWKFHNGQIEITNVYCRLKSFDMCVTDKSIFYTMPKLILQ